MNGFDKAKFREFLSDKIAPKTVIDYSDEVGYFLNRIGDRKIGSEDELVDIMGNYIASHLTHWNVRFALRYYLEYIGKKELYQKIIDKYRRKFKFPARKKELKSVPFECIKKISDLMPLPYNIIFMIQYDTGFRISDVLNLNMNDIEMDNDENVLLGKIEKKTKKKRVVMLSKETAVEMAKWIRDMRLDNKDQLFHTDKDRYNRWLRRIGKKLGYSEMSSHWVRHSRAIHLYDKGWDIKTIQRFLNHSNLQTTDMYLRSAGVENKKLMKADPPKW